MTLLLADALLFAVLLGCLIFVLYLGGKLAALLSPNNPIGLVLAPGEQLLSPPHFSELMQSGTCPSSFPFTGVFWIVLDQSFTNANVLNQSRAFALPLSLMKFKLAFHSAEFVSRRKSSKETLTMYLNLSQLTRIVHDFSMKARSSPPQLSASLS